MSGITISSWNAQGNFRMKYQFLGPILSSWDSNVILVQEQGNPDTTGFNRGEIFEIGSKCFVCAFCFKDPTATNFRCTTAVFVESELYPHIVDRGIYSVAVGRPLVYIDLASGVRIATVHSIANNAQSVQDNRNYIKWLDYDSLGKNWIMMGDFNSEPIQYPECIYGNSITLSPNSHQSIPYWIYSTGGIEFCNILFDANPTQGANGVRNSNYDFIFYSDTPSFRIGGIINQKIYLPEYGVISDHNLIQTTIWM